MGPGGEVALGRPRWRLRLVGVVEVSAADRGLESPQVVSRKARTLLGLLGARGGSAVAVDRVVETLWDGAPPRHPEANVATLVSRLRAAFGPEMVVGGRAGYRLGESTRVDLHEAAAHVAGAEAWLGDDLPERALVAAERAIRLLDGGPVLADHPGAPWAARARDLQDTLLRRAWHAGAASALRTGRPRRAQVLAEAAIAADQLDEAAYRLLMRACAAAGEPARAVLTYQRLRTTLAVELGAEPDPASGEVHVTILRTNAATG